MRCVITFALAFLCLVKTALGQPVAEQGVLDARLFDFTSKRVALSGTWLWHDNQLLKPREAFSQKGSPIDFPKTWNEVRASKSGLGYATYTLTILPPREVSQFAIELPQIYSSYHLWVNDQLIAANGTPGKTIEETKAQWMPQTVTFENEADSIYITLQIANFHHNKGGCKDPVYFGEGSNMVTKRSIATVSKLMECTVLLAMAVIFTIIYFNRGKKKVVMYFALLCLSWAIRSVFSNDYTYISFFPDFDWILMVKIEYITLYLTMIWAILYLSRLFANEGNQIIKYLLVTLNSLYAAFTIITSPFDFTRLLPAYLITSGVILIYGAVIVFRAFINERVGSNFLTVSILLALAIFSYDIFTYEGLFSYNSILFSAGYVTIFSLMGVALLLHLGIIKSSSRTTTVLTYEDLYGDGKR